MKRWEVLLLAGIALTVGGGWWLFGYSTIHGPALHGHRWVDASHGTMTAYRYLGREVRLDYDFDRDGRVDESRQYTWERPANHHHEPQVTVSDHDGDGRWDLWMFPDDSGLPGYPMARFEVDTDRDGRPDWKFVGPESQDTKLAIIARRGF